MIAGQPRAALSPSGAEGARGAVRPRTRTRAWSAQYFRYLGNVVDRFNFGESLTTRAGQRRSARIVLDAVPWTLGLVGVVTVLAFILGTGIGILSCLAPRRLASTASCRRSS